MIVMVPLIVAIRIPTVVLLKAIHLYCMIIVKYLIFLYLTFCER